MDFVDGLDAARLLTDRYPAGMPIDEVARILTARPVSAAGLAVGAGGAGGAVVARLAAGAGGGSAGAAVTVDTAEGGGYRQWTAAFTPELTG